MGMPDFSSMNLSRLLRQGNSDVINDAVKVEDVSKDRLEIKYVVKGKDDKDIVLKSEVYTPSTIEELKLKQQSRIQTANAEIARLDGLLEKMSG
jgi:hypothetical protein